MPQGGIGGYHSIGSPRTCYNLPVHGAAIAYFFVLVFLAARLLRPEPHAPHLTS